MTVELRKVGPSITLEMVEAFEASLPAPLPADYRAFLLQHNGGHPRPCWRPPELPGGGFGVAGLLGLGDVETYNSLKITRENFRGHIPGDLLAVAYDSGGSQICVSLVGEDRGSVWFFDSDLEVEVDEVQDPELLTRVCASFQEFWDSLETPPDDLDEMDRRLDAAEAARGR